MKKQIFPVTLKFMTRLLTKYEVQQNSFDTLKNLHKLLKYFQNFSQTLSFGKDYTTLRAWKLENSQIFGFVSDFDELYLEEYLELEKNKICFGYLLLAKRSFPGSFHGSGHIRALYPLQT